MLNNETLARELEETAVSLAWGAGEILASHFGRQISIEYKDEHQRDPVTAVDKAAQEYLVAGIAARFPDHGILGEEDADDSESPAPDFLWVLDPLDGTTNFINGLPVYACSVGLLYRGRPLAGALYVPWPKPGGGFILHCRRGGGCCADGEPVSVYKSEEPVNNRLSGLPGGLGQSMSFGGGLHGKIGEIRTTGSIAYELAMTACGVMQYSIFGAPHMWDMAAGVLAVQEAGGTVMTRFPKEKRWHPLDSLVPTWETQAPTFKELRRWVAPLVAGNQQVAPLVAHNLRRRFRPVAKLRQLSRRLRPRKKT
ncbi:MAG: hypothetical protein BZY88_01865 [SAR202 cluster bacterium Io17-Chloro-G9]|nr:MAG: hypothetical protein BZY88_01865 [SAR202 cluster bacterium Io17-Chloro-G9]